MSPLDTSPEGDLKKAHFFFGFFGFLGFFGSGLGLVLCLVVPREARGRADAIQAVFVACGAEATARALDPMAPHPGLGRKLTCHAPPEPWGDFQAEPFRLPFRDLVKQGKHIFSKVCFLGLLHASEVVNEAGHVFPEGLGKEGVHFGAVLGAVGVVVRVGCGGRWLAAVVGGGGGGWVG